MFGAQLPKRAMPRLAPVLLERWLPGAREDTLARLANITQTALGKAYADHVYRDARQPDPASCRPARRPRTSSRTCATRSTASTAHPG